MVSIYHYKIDEWSFDFYISFSFQKTYPKLPSEGFAQIRIFNTMNCPVTLTMTQENKDKIIEIKSLSMWADLEVEAHGSVTLPYTANFTTCNNKGYTNLINEVPGKIQVELYR